jgi:hypothetical protein
MSSVHPQITAVFPMSEASGVVSILRVSGIPNCVSNHDVCVFLSLVIFVCCDPCGGAKAGTQPKAKGKRSRLVGKWWLDAARLAALL